MSFASASDNIIKEVDILVNSSQELFEKEDYEKGLEKLDQATALCEDLEKNYGTIKIDPLMIYGVICLDVGKHEEALEYFEKANEKLKIVVKPPFEEKLYVLKGLEECYIALDKKEKLIGVYEEFYGIHVKNFGLEHEKTIPYMRALLYAYIEAGIKEKSSRLIREMIKVAGRKPDLIKDKELDYLNNILKQAEDF